MKQKFELFLRETVDPFTILSGAAGAALSQSDNDDPKYGQGSGPYAERFGAAVADITTQNFFSDAVLSSILHEDPRYFRRGPQYRFWYRLGYSLSRMVVTQTDQASAFSTTPISAEWHWGLAFPMPTIPIKALMELKWRPDSEPVWLPQLCPISCRNSGRISNRSCSTASRASGLLS